MRKTLVFFALLLLAIGAISFAGKEDHPGAKWRRIYSRPPAKWPAPQVDAGTAWNELGILPKGPLAGHPDSAKGMIELGKQLFFDTRLSGDGKISCGSCHQPQLSWTDTLDRSIGHKGAINKRNSPTLHNVWFYKKLFWDGRASSLEDQAFAPINSESEMGHDMRSLPFALRKIKGYRPLFTAAFGDADISPDRIAEALAMFQRTISSRESRFDAFLKGDKKALTNSELNGMHLFRTQARCINCHNGPLFSDNQFHNNGFANNDPGRYNITHLPADKGLFKTPSLRDVAQTGPWMHDGAEKKLEQVIARYNEGHAPGADKKIRPLGLSKQEQADLLAFLKAISAPPLNFTKPLPVAD